MGPGQAKARQKKENWDDLTYDKRMMILLETVKILKTSLKRYELFINDLLNHQHNPITGNPQMIKRVGEDAWPQPQATTDLDYLPIDNYNFEEKNK